MGAKAVVKYASLGKYRRVIAVSDLHGDNDGFLGMLKQADFGEKDALVIVGDILEKGEQSLPLLRTVVRLAKAGNLYMVAGNNDTIFTEWYSGEVSDEDIRAYMNARERIVLREMADKLGMDYQTLSEVQALKAAIKEHYAAEISFLDSLPHILDTEYFTFVHAGLKPGPLTEQDRDYCLTATHFGAQTHRFEKPVIVGHWPASNYQNGIVNVNPYFNWDTNVISIDGGNNLKRWGQINYLVLQQDKIECGAFNHMPQFIALDDQEASKDPLTLEFPRTEVEIIREGETETVCFVPALNREMTVPKGELYTYKGKRYRYNMTTYRLPVKAGEVLSCCAVEPQGVLAMRDGIAGYYTGRYEFL